MEILFQAMTNKIKKILRIHKYKILLGLIIIYLLIITDKTQTDLFAAFIFLALYSFFMSILSVTETRPRTPTLMIMPGYVWLITALGAFYDYRYFLYSLPLSAIVAIQLDKIIKLNYSQ